MEGATVVQKTLSILLRNRKTRKYADYGVTELLFVFLLYFSSLLHYMTIFPEHPKVIPSTEL
jgi:hypothetical protein